MQTRNLGSTGMTVSEIGLGTWALGGDWGAQDDDASVALLAHAFDVGITLVDTAHMYGQGHSERVIGRALAEHRGDRTVRVATKVPPKNRKFPAPLDTDVDDAFPAGHIRAHTEQSLADLGVETLDVQQLHVWAPDWLGRGDWERDVAALKDEGLIRAFGVSVNDHQPATALEVVRSGVVDTVQIIYNVFDQSPEDGLLEACAEHGVGVIVRVALDEGGLTGRIREGVTFEADDWRNKYFRGDRAAETGRRADAIVTDLGIEPDGLAATALRYPLSSDAVSSVVVGTRSVRNLERNAALGDGHGLPADQRAALHRHRWDRNFYA